MYKHCFQHPLMVRICEYIQKSKIFFIFYNRHKLIKSFFMVYIFFKSDMRHQNMVFDKQTRPFYALFG